MYNAMYSVLLTVFHTIFVKKLLKKHNRLRVAVFPFLKVVTLYRNNNTTSWGLSATGEVL